MYLGQWEGLYFHITVEGDEQRQHSSSWPPPGTDRSSPWSLGPQGKTRVSTRQWNSQIPGKRSERNGGEQCFHETQTAMKWKSAIYWIHSSVIPRAHCPGTTIIAPETAQHSLHCVHAHGVGGNIHLWNLDLSVMVILDTLLILGSWRHGHLGVFQSQTRSGSVRKSTRSKVERGRRSASERREVGRRPLE